MALIDRHVLQAAAVAVLIHALSPIASGQIRADVYIAGLSRPVAFVQDPSDAAIQYIVEQDGRIRVVSNGVLQSADFLDLSAHVSAGGERGLLGLAFPADYGSSRRFYVNFTNPAGHTVVARFTRSIGNALVADETSRFDLRWPDGNAFITQTFANHNGGTLAFGPDGYLYIAMGDGGSGDDPFHNAQDPGSLLGKMLRIDVAVADSDAEGYDVPADNPFVDGSPVAALHEIWAFGLRNPWKFSFDDPARGGTGALIIGDVGQNSWEEIDYEPAGRGGRNYGWRNREGAHDNVTSLPPAYTPLTDPIFEYDHSVGNSITGGVVYRGSIMGSSLHARYFFADIVGRVWSLTLTINGTTGEASASGLIEHTAELGGSGALGLVSSFGVDASAELYVVSLTLGRVLRLSSSVPGEPDTDHDGLPDSWEVQYGLDPNILGDVNADPDNDGFTNLQEYQRGSHPTRMLVSPNIVDLDGDRGGDVFLYNASTGAWRFQLSNRLTTGFTERSSSWDPGWRVFPTNLDGDSYTDIFLYDPARGLWAQARNNAGDGTFVYTVGSWDRDWQIYPADLDGNGVTDLFVYNATTGVWVKCFVDGTGDFSNYVVGHWDPGWTFTTADMNGDGRDDFFLYNRGNGVWVQASSQAGVGGSFDYLASGRWDLGWDIYPADLNGDGLTDLFLYNASAVQNPAGVRVTALSRAGGDFDYPIVGQWEAGWAILPADLNPDNRTDLFLYNEGTGVWVQAFSNGAGDFTYAVGQWDPGWRLSLTDFNEDGLSDILVENAGGTWVQATNTGPGTFAYVVGNWGTGWMPSLRMW